MIGKTESVHLANYVLKFTVADVELIIVFFLGHYLQFVLNILQLKMCNVNN